MNLSPRMTSLTRALLKSHLNLGHACTCGALWLLIGVVACCTAGNLFWLRRHILTIPPPWDQAFYLYMGVRYLHALSDGGILGMAREFVRLSPDVAPLFPLTTVPLYMLLGSSRLVAHLTNTLYLVLLLSGIYLLGAHIYSRRTGLLAAFIMATFTATVNFSRDYLLEFPATAFVTLAVYACIRAEAFRHRPWCLAFGALAGLGVLTKTMSGVFFIGPVLFLLGSLTRQRQLTAAVVCNCLLAVGMGVLVASIWWGPNFRTAFGYLIYYGFREGAVPYSGDGREILTLQNMTYYALALMNYGTSFLYGLLFIGLMLVRGFHQMRRRDGRVLQNAASLDKEGMLWVWLLIGYALLTMVPNKGEARYAQPLLPPIALLLAGSVDFMVRRWLRRAVVVIVAVIGVLNYVGLTYGLPLLPQRLYAHPFVLINQEYPHYSWVRSKSPLESDIHWPISDILAVLADLAENATVRGMADREARFLDLGPSISFEEDVRRVYRMVLRREPDQRGFKKYTQALKDGRLSREALLDVLMTSAEFRAQRSKVLVVPDHPQFNASTLRYYAELDRLPHSFAHLVEGEMSAAWLRTHAFVLVKSDGYQGPEFSIRYNDQIHAELLLPDSGFVPLPERFLCPDQAQIIIFVATSVLN
jgi:hypothetical protein